MKKVDVRPTRGLNYYACWVLSLATVIVPMFLWAMDINNTSGWFPHLGRDLALWFALPLFNFLSWAANLSYATRHRPAPTLLWVLIVLQTLGVLATLFVASVEYRDLRAQQRVQSLQSSVWKAVREDDTQKLEEAFNRCAEICAKEGFKNEMLLLASRAQAQQSIRRLIHLGARVTAELGSPKSDEHTCEGLYFPGLSALELSVLHGNEEQFLSLLPASDDNARRRATWLAAQMDRLPLLQKLLNAGTPIDLSGPILDGNLTLLNAAAEGAALDVARWLIEEKRFNPNGDDKEPESRRGVTPLQSLIRYSGKVPDSVRTEPFLRLLKSTGADLRHPITDAEYASPLEFAIWERDITGAEALIAAGVMENSLSAFWQQKLRELRADKPAGRRNFDRDRENCIPSKTIGKK